MAKNGTPRQTLAAITAATLSSLAHHRVAFGVFAVPTLAPYAAENHPTDEHLMPLFIALGAGEGIAGQRVHSSTRSGVISMDTYAFG